MLIDLPNEVVEAMDVISTYMWPDEEADFNSTPESEREGHVFNSLQVVDAFLDRVRVQNEGERS